MTARCRICNSENIDSPMELRETMFGTGEPFLYERCLECGCLQILEQPTDMSKYYPHNYYSYAPGSGGFVDAVKRRAQTILSIHGPAWLFAGRDWWEVGVRKSIRDMGLSRSARILDVGCGHGNLIASLAEVGFHNVLGADPFIPHDIVHPNGARVLKCEVNEVEGQFDVVMMHHSLEHIWNQHGTVANVARLVKSGGRCLIRIPTIDCWAWEEYGRDWIALDPPRHFYLHSRSSISRLLGSEGFRLDRIVDDGSLLQILGSEKIKRGQPLLSPKTGKTEYDKFLPQELIQAASARSRELNLAGRGDSIAVHAYKP